MELLLDCYQVKLLNYIVIKLCLNWLYLCGVATIAKGTDQVCNKLIVTKFCQMVFKNEDLDQVFKGGPVVILRTQVF